MAKFDIQALSQEIVKRIISVTEPEQIILFGSAATGQITDDSDIDLLVVQPNSQNNRAEQLHIREALKTLNHAFDIFVMSRERFEESKSVIGGIAYPANKYGRVLYEVSGKG